ncbi:hypothetical protein [Gemella haemolysans]|uniref:Uncharacterized protein n=1 Tax=Gemella haemolysans M341 TaxID=562981 RepID=A0AA87B041_9BACL|nr:hypothetical protein [Gemella haemolysans]EGF88495.1 hypothetical protein HMPREF0428_01013 [Gemella haemolysans M341]
MKVTVATNAPLSDVALGNLEKFLSKFFTKHPDKLKVIRGEQSG